MTQANQTPETLVVERNKYSVLTESDIDRYYAYDLGLINAVTHNGSMAGLHNPIPVVTRENDFDTVIHRAPNETLTIGVLYGEHGTELGLFVSDPHVDDCSEEMTAIYLSPREMRVLRTLLNQMARGEERNVA